MKWQGGDPSEEIQERSELTAAVTALHNWYIAASAEKCSGASTGTIAAANPSSGAVSADWTLPDWNAMPGQ